MSNSKMGRRDAARRALTVLGAAVLAPSVLTACGEEGGALSCNDTSGLEPAQLAVRESQNYLEVSPNAEQTCASCRFFTAGAAGQCGTCTVIQGPINPAGYCALWAAVA